MSYLPLKSGTDVRGYATDLGGHTVGLTDNAVYDITAAFVCYMVDRLGSPAEEMTFAVGRDSRITGEHIAQIVTNALTDAGIRVLSCGLASTPAMFMTTVELNATAAVQITASHHPFDRNGLKFFTDQGGLEADELTEILNLADEGQSYLPTRKGTVEPVDFMPRYAAGLRRLICNQLAIREEDKPLKGYHIVVDAGNGAGGFYATEVLEKLGADISGSRYLEPDGMFPNHIPNPEDKSAMKSICEAVLQSNADLGIIFDTDVDRAGCVGRDGEEINRNRLIGLAAKVAIGDRTGCTIVTDSVTSDGLKYFLEEILRCRHYRYRRGYKNVIDKAIELNQAQIDAPLAIETSGHAAFRENYFLDDGAYLVTRIVIELAKGLDIESFLSTMPMPLEEREWRLQITADDFHTYGQKVIDDLSAYCSAQPDMSVADDNREGIRVSTPDGWFLLRLSVHDPVMPMNFESPDRGGVDRMLHRITPFFDAYKELDTSRFF